MTEYVVIPFSDRIRHVTASSAYVARNKYTKEMGEETYVLVMPISHGFRGRGTIATVMTELWRCTIEKLNEKKKVFEMIKEGVAKGEKVMK